MKDLILIVCYMGKLPSYFSMFIDSCAWNSKIDFLIVTDNFIDAETLPQNIQIVNKGIEDIGNLIKTLPERKQRKDLFALHINISNMCIAQFRDHALNRLIPLVALA